MTNKLEAEHNEALGGGPGKKLDWDKILNKPKTSEQNTEDTTAEVQETEEKLFTAYDQTAINIPTNIQQVTPDIIERAQKNRGQIPSEKKKEYTAAIFKELGKYDPNNPEQYSTQIASIANRTTAPTKDIVSELINNSNNIAQLGTKKGFRGKIFSTFGFSDDQIA